MPRPNEMNFSLSAFQDWQQCEAKYNFNHVRKLRSTFKMPALERGIILHDYLETYYNAIKASVDAASAHEMGMAKLAQHTQRVEIAAAGAHYGGDAELALDLARMPDELRDIATRYHRIRGYGDAQRFQVLIVEHHLNVLLVQGIRSNSVIDLVTRDRENGRVFLWEHKTTGNVPSSAFRIRDLQTTLYAEVLWNQMKVKVDEIMWNYLRTKVPQIPHQNKATKANPVGPLSKAVNVDTTWEVYSARLTELGLDFEDYVDVFQRLKDAEQNVFYPRYANQVVVDQQELLIDYAVEAGRARQARYMWANGMSRPTRTLTRGCDYCPFIKICEAELMGGDGEEVVRLRFVENKEEQK